MRDELQVWLDECDATLQRMRHSMQDEDAARMRFGQMCQKQLRVWAQDENWRSRLAAALHDGMLDPAKITNRVLHTFGYNSMEIRIWVGTMMGSLPLHWVSTPDNTHARPFIAMCTVEWAALANSQSSAKDVLSFSHYLSTNSWAHDIALETLGLTHDVANFSLVAMLVSKHPPGKRALGMVVHCLERGPSSSAASWAAGLVEIFHIFHPVWLEHVRQSLGILHDLGMLSLGFYDSKEHRGVVDTVAQFLSPVAAPEELVCDAV